MSEFVKRYGGIYEHSPWVAERIEHLLDADNPDLGVLARLMADCVDNASKERQLDLLRAHPDLAVREADELTAASSQEQASAGLDRCTAEEFRQFDALNKDYKARFGFPFIIAVRGLDRRDILSAFQYRIDNDPDSEFETALQEVHRIARLRLEAMA